MYEKFQELLDSRGITAYKVSKATGISTATLTSWKQGKYSPKLEKLQKIADYFGVPVEYLMTGEAPNPQKFTVVPDFNEFEKALVRAYREADEPIQIAIDRLLKIEDLRTALFSQKSKEA